MTSMPRLLAAIYDPLMKATEEACLTAWRADLLAPLGGAVLEVGAGTGANLAHYSPAVSRLVLAEPDPAMRARLARKVRRRATAIVDAAAEKLPFADGEFDAVVCTLVLCSTEDPGGALTEMRRVLRPSGRLAFIEHVAAAEGSNRLRWQRRIEPLWKRLMGNCHLTRRTNEAIAAAGFALDEVRQESLRKAFPLVRPSIRGIAVRREPR
jgi:ubiquinone/menaquinone biosynthesis C-methylase UbiE